MKTRITDLCMQLDPGNVSHCFMRALIGVNSIKSYDDICDVFGKGNGISPAPPPQWKVRPSYGDYRGGVISMRGDLYIQDTVARECV